MRSFHMLSVQKILTLFVATMAVAACSKKENLNPFDNAKAAGEERDLQSKDFTSACSFEPLDAIYTAILSSFEASIKASRVSYRFEGANVTRTTEFYSDAECSGKSALLFSESGEFKLNKDHKTKDGGKGIDIDYKELSVTAQTADGVTAAEAIELCGRDSWKKGTEENVTSEANDTNCLGVKMPRHNSNIYRVDANVLYLGDTASDSSQPEDRPARLNKSVKYSAAR